MLSRGARRLPSEGFGTPEPFVGHRLQVQVPASLIMRTEPPSHTVFVSSQTEGNPYDVGREYEFIESLYCYGVFENDGELLVEDATQDPDWADNADLDHGMSFYIGYPLKWPGGEPFGTICVLDRKRNEHALL